MRSLMLAAVLLAGCGGTRYAPATTTEPSLLANPYPPAEVRAAVVRALEGRRFHAESEEPGRVRARLDRGDASLVLDVEYSPTQLVVRYVSSRGLRTQPGPTGEVLVEDRWLAWANGLRARIREELLVPAKQAAETARREREYQLLLEQHRTAQAQANAAAAQAGAGGPPEPAAPPGPALVVPLPAPTVQMQNRVLQGNQTITCCINGTAYACPSQQAFERCMSLTPSECTRAPERTCR